MSNPYNEFTQMLNLGTDSELELNLMKENKVEFRKQFGKLLKKSKQDAKNEECFYCGEKCSSFCNSHSVPAYFLKNIAVEGKIYSNNSLISIPLLDEDKGVNQSGTFQIICRNCDSKIFRDYEDPKNYTDIPTPKMIAQIAMKNSLKSISKRKSEIALYNNIPNLSSGFHKQKQLVNDLDLQEYIEDFNRAKRIMEKGLDNEYYLFYHQKLDYVVPIAFQSNVALLFDFEGANINNIYNHSPDYHIKCIHICVFPLENSSVIMMFVDSKDKRYRSFYKQFKKLSPKDKLAAVNFIIFSLSEDVFINKEVDLEILKQTGLAEVSKMAPEIASLGQDFDPVSIARENFDFSKMNEIPNLLLEEYKVR